MCIRDRDTTDGVLIAGADLFGYSTRYKSTTTVAVLSYIDVSPDNRTWIPLQTTAMDSLFSAGAEDSLTYTSIDAIPDDMAYARARLVGRVAANQTVTSWVWWTLVWIGQNRMR